MQKSFPFNSVAGDRKYKAEEWTEYFSAFITNGVFPNPSSGLQVLANNSMVLTVKAGRAWINGYFYLNTGDLAVTLATADGVLARIDRIVVRWSLQTRRITIEVKQGSYSASPQASTLSRDADTYELAIADVLVGGGVVSVGQAQITDQRLNDNLCGLVVGTVGELDTTGYNSQLQAMITEYQSLSAASYNGYTAFIDGLKISSNNDYAAFGTWLANYETQASQAFTEWFEMLQETLDENAAANLLNQITVLSERIELLEKMIFTSEVTTNPYMILFDNLDGVVADGVWNQGLRCLEC